ncbi:MAG TPA: substrate-binding domain-containing protein [Acidimicrobiia bacterium]|jgi:hypothetical protein
MSRRRRRAAAVVAVVVMLGVAWVVRGALDGPGPKPPPGRPTLACASELHDVCVAIAADGDVVVVEEPANTTAARLGAMADDKRDTESVDGWLTIDPQPGIVDDAHVRQQRDPVFGTPERLARSPLVFVIWKDRLQVLAGDQACGSRARIDWRCLGDLAETPWSAIGGPGDWGSVAVGHADPAGDTVGVLALGQEATSKLGRVDLARSDIEDDEFYDWFADVERRVRPAGAGGPLALMLTRGPSEFGVAQVTEAEACTDLRGSSRRSALDVVVPEPVTTADVVFAPRRGGKDIDALRDAVTGATARHALRSAGWRLGNARERDQVCREAGSLALGASSKTPPPGVLVTLLGERGQ